MPILPTMHVKREAIEQARRFPTVLHPNHNFQIHEQRTIQQLRFLREREPFSGPHPLAMDAPTNKHVFILHAQKGPTQNPNLRSRVHKTFPIQDNHDSLLQIRRLDNHPPPPKHLFSSKLALQNPRLHPRARQNHYPPIPIILKSQ